MSVAWKAKVSVAMLMAVAFDPSAVAAQTRTQSNIARPRDIPFPESPKARAETRRLSNSYADCVVAQHPQLARRYIVEQWPNKEVLKGRGERLILRECATIGVGRYSFRFRGGSYRHELALALFDRDLASAPALTGLDPVEPLDTTLLDEAVASAQRTVTEQEARASTKRKDVEALAVARDSLTFAKIERMMAALAECAVRADAGAAAAFLRAEATSDEERTAGRALAPALGGCVTRDVQFTVRIDQLRGPLAVAYYRLADKAGVLPDPGTRR